MKAFAVGVLLAWALEASLLLALVDFTALEYPLNDAIAIVVVGLLMGGLAGSVSWALSKELTS